MAGACATSNEAAQAEIERIVFTPETMLKPRVFLQKPASFAEPPAAGPPGAAGHAAWNSGSAGCWAVAAAQGRIRPLPRNPASA